MAELVDALASGASGRTVVEVRVFSWAPIFSKNPFRVRYLMGFLIFYSPRYTPMRSPHLGIDTQSNATVVFRTVSFDDKGGGMPQGPGRPSKRLDDLQCIEYMAELWCCGKSTNSVRAASLIAAGVQYADGSPKPPPKEKQRPAPKPPITNQLTPKRQPENESEKAQAKPESVADRLARRFGVLQEKELAVPLSVFCVLRQANAIAIKRDRPDAYGATRLLGLVELDDLRSHVHPEAVTEVSNRCKMSESEILSLALQGASVYRRLRQGDETIFSW